jgi:hypothetical protein
MSFSVSLAIAFEDKTVDQRRFTADVTEKSRFAGSWLHVPGTRRERRIRSVGDPDPAVETGRRVDGL